MAKPAGWLHCLINLQGKGKISKKKRLHDIVYIRAPVHPLSHPSMETHALSARLHGRTSAWEPELHHLVRLATHQQETSSCGHQGDVFTAITCNLKKYLRYPLWGSALCCSLARLGLRACNNYG
jgi:hypothetical protein